MPEMILPGVYIEVRAEALIVGGAITVGNIGIVGTASAGPIGEIASLGSFAEARESFGASDAYDGTHQELTLVRALELAYAGGASTVSAIRVTSVLAAPPADPNQKKETWIPAWEAYTKARKASISVAGETGTAANLRAKYAGSYGNDLQLNVWDADTDSFIASEVHTGPTAKLNRKPIVQGDPRNRIQVVTPATGRSRVFVVGYGAAPPAVSGHVNIDPATGNLHFIAAEAPAAGDTLTASYVVPQASSRKVTIAAGSATEDYTVADGQHLVDQVTERSQAVEKGPDAPNLSSLPKKSAAVDAFENFGGPGDIPGSNGEDAGPADYQRGLEQLINADVQIVVAAGMDDTQIGADLTAHVTNASTDKIKRDRIGIVGSRVNATLPQIAGHALADPRIVFVAPGIQATDSASGQKVFLSGAYAAAMIAGMVSALDPQVSLTNKPVPVDGLQTVFTPDKLEQLVQARVLALEEHLGRRVVKGITTDTGAFRQITVRRIVDFAKYGVRQAADPFIGLLNNERVRKALKGSINGFLAGMVDDEQLVTYDLDVTATRDEEIRGIARVTMTLQPTFSIDYIKVVMYLG